MSVEVDHLVVAAATLAEGVRWCGETLGVLPLGGGRHPLMGTHNRLVNLSGPDFPNSYLEIIAIDPEAPPPGRARWFGLDALDLRSGPRLVHVVMRTPTLDAHRQALAAQGIDTGPALAAHRDTPAGRLHWRIAVRDDGALPDEGRLPVLIEWDGPHPAGHLPDQGLHLSRLTLPDWPQSVRDALSPPSPAWNHGATLSATLDTPLGPRTMTA